MFFVSFLSLSPVMTSLFLANYESNLGITNSLFPDELIILPLVLNITSLSFPALIFVLGFRIIIRLFIK
ncbi:hypothetical protein BDF14DRAFT_1429374 [Spinellus fusiger]|nr:hypothetical protein BDF14DRAFT_1429374 [Spinellus fusiger]